MSTVITRVVDVVAGTYCALVGTVLLVGFWDRLCASGSTWPAHASYHDTSLEMFAFALWIAAVVWCGVRTATRSI